MAELPKSKQSYRLAGTWSFYVPIKIQPKNAFTKDAFTKTHCNKTIKSQRK